MLATFGYDDLGRRTSIARGNGTTTSYGYDAVSRLASLNQDLGGTGADLALGFQYNKAGQIAELTRSRDLYAFTAPTYGGTLYETGGLNQLIEIGAALPTHDGRGNLTFDGAKSYSYSTENLLVAGPNGATLTYDPAMRLYETNATGVASRKFAYDGADLIAEYDSNNALTRRHVHGPGVDEPLVTYEGAGTGTRRWLHADERGSIVASSNVNGAVVATNKYDEYGVPGSANEGRFQYTGQTWLPELGLNYYKARMYDPKLGRFLQSDPIGFGQNFYAYAGCDPVNRRDPWGLAEEEIVITARFRYDQPTNVPFLMMMLSFIGELETALEGDREGGKEVPKCAKPGTRFEKPLQAGIAGVQAGRAAQKKAGDDNERSFSILPLKGGGYTFSSFLVGDRDSVPMVVPGNAVGAGHIHTTLGGDELSKSADQYDDDRDQENVVAFVRGTGNKDFLSVLGGSSRRIFSWNGRNGIKGPGKDVGSDECVP